MTAPARDGYEHVTTLPTGHGLTAHLYRRAPQPPPLVPGGVTSDDPPPWLQPEPPDDLPAGMETVTERWAALSPETRASLSQLSPAQLSALGYPDGAA